MPRKSSLNVDEVLIEQLARGASQTEAARVAGCGRKKVYLSLQKPEFCKAVEDFRTSMIDQAIGKLASGLSKSVERLEHLMMKATPDAAQVAAAKSHADLLVKFREIQLESRMAELQARLEAVEKSQQAGRRP